MDALPPNDPNRNNNNNNNNQSAGKEQPYDGRRSQRNRQNHGTNNNGQDGGTMDVIGDLQDSPIVVVMFLVGVATWFLRERCVC